MHAPIRRSGIGFKYDVTAPLYTIVPHPKLPDCYECLGSFATGLPTLLTVPVHTGSSQSENLEVIPFALGPV